MVRTRMVRVMPLRRLLLALRRISLARRELCFCATAIACCAKCARPTGGGAAVMVGVLHQRIGDAGYLVAQQCHRAPAADVADVSMLGLEAANGRASWVRMEHAAQTESAIAGQRAASMAGPSAGPGSVVQNWPLSRRYGRDTRQCRPQRHWREAGLKMAWTSRSMACGSSKSSSPKRRKNSPVACLKQKSKLPTRTLAASLLVENQREIL